MTLPGDDDHVAGFSNRDAVCDRGASIRIPLDVTKKGYGYFEDRRPCANIDPYVVTRLLLETCCS